MITKKQLISICCYVAFLGLFTGWSMLAYGNQDLYYLSDRVKSVTTDKIFSTPDGQQTTFKGIINVNVMYHWLKNVFTDSLIDETWANGDNMQKSDMYYVNNYNRLIGGIRVRQLRILPNEKCKVDPVYQNLIKSCYAEYSSLIEDKTSFGPNNTYTWTNSELSQEIIYNGKNVWYQGSGYIVEIPLNYTTIVNTFSALEKNLFIDRQTRVFFVDFNTYNAALNIHLVGRLSFEFLETGGIRPSVDLSPIILFRYQSSLTLSIELLTFIIFIIYMGFELYLIYDNRIEYFKNPWNVIEMFNFLILIITMISRIYSIVWISDKMNLYNTSYIPLQKMVFTNDIERYASGINALLLWIKLFRYLSFIKRFQFIFDLLSYAISDLFFFFVVFFIFIIGMSQMGFLFFSQDVIGFRSFMISIVTLMKAVTNGLDSESLELSNRFFGPLFFLSFNILVILILVNVFLAIITEAYEEISRRRRLEKEDMVISNLIEFCDFKQEDEVKE